MKKIFTFFFFLDFLFLKKYRILMKKLTTRKVISIHGEGVLAFLQGLITQDTQLLSRSGGKTAIASLFLNPKGRVISDALIVKRGSAEEPQGVFLDVPSVHADKIANLLTRHKLRLPMSIEKAENQSVFVTNDSDFSFEDPRVPSLPRRCLSPCEPGVVDTIQDVDFERERLMAGVVEGQDLPPDSIPIFYNFDFFNCISFNKGCYTGQELITRTLRRGIVRRRVVPLKTVDGSSIKQGGKVFSDGSREIGTIFACARDVGLAVLQLDSPQGLNEKPAYRTALLSAGTLTIDHEVSVCLVVPKYS